MLTYKTKNFIKQSHAAVIIAGCLPTNSILGLANRFSPHLVAHKGAFQTKSYLRSG